MALMLASSAQAQSWQPEAWRKYIIGRKVAADTVRPARSLMGEPIELAKPFDPRLFRCVTGTDFIKDLPRHRYGKPKLSVGSDDRESLFAEQDRQMEAQRAASGDYRASDLLGDILLDIVNILIFKNK